MGLSPMALDFLEYLRTGQTGSTTTNSNKEMLLAWSNGLSGKIGWTWTSQHQRRRFDSSYNSAFFLTTYDILLDLVSLTA